MTGKPRSGVEVGTKPSEASRGTPWSSTPLFNAVGVLLLVSVGLLVWVAVGTIRASRDMTVRSGLDYDAFLGAVDELLEDAGEEALLRFHEVSQRLPNRRRVTYDTITIVADVGAFPAFAEAGFLYDQVQDYNRFQRDRLDLALEDPEWWDRLKAYNPSIFRPARRPDGSRVPSRAPAAWSLRVRSPLEGEWDGEVQAQDLRRGMGLLSPQATVPLNEHVRLVRRVKNRRQPCEFVPSSDEVNVYCLSEQRIPQAVLRPPEARGGRGWITAGWADLWMDGRRVESGDSARLEDGAMLRLAPLEPVVLGDHWKGVLSSEQWINGRMRRRSLLPAPLDMFAGLGAGPLGSEARVDATASVALSVHAEASLELSQRLDDFLTSEVDLPVDFGMVVLASVPDGRIVAVAEVGERRNPGRSSLLERVAPGSAVKPLLAAAVLSERPELGAMRIRARTGSVRSVLGLPSVPSRRAFSSTLNCAPPQDGRIGLEYFLRCSNNEYAVSLVVAGLAEEGVPGSTWNSRDAIPLNGQSVPRGALLQSPLSRGLGALFDLPTDPTISDYRQRARRPWDGLQFSDGSPYPVPFEVLPSESRPALLAPGSDEGTDISLLYRYAYGAWENQWTLLDLTNGFGRIITDRRLQLKFFGDARGAEGAQASGDLPADPQGLGLGGHGWYGDFLEGLERVGVDGTADGLRSAWRREGLPGRVFAKTGTLNEAGEATPADDLFTKSLLFGVGPDGETTNGPLSCGLVGGIYLRFERGPRSGNLPSFQVEFANEELGPFLAAHWADFGLCGPDSVEGTVEED